MIYKKIELTQILQFLGDKVLKVMGPTDGVYIDNLADMEHVNNTTLDWVKPSNASKQQVVENSKARVLLVDPEIQPVEGKTLIAVKNPKVALAEIGSHFFIEVLQPCIHPTAVVHPDAVIGKNNYIGPNCYIGKCTIGDNNVIHSNVSIYDRTVIGNNNVIHSGAIICVDGLGCMRDKEGRLQEFPQVGGVVIGNDTYIGGNTHIASGSLSDTIIGNGCKINGMCFIGSNDMLHDNVWITGSTMLAGSVEVGKNTTIYSRVIIREWCKIGKGVTIGMGSVVTKNIPDGETWFGSPAKKMERK